MQFIIVNIVIYMFLDFKIFLDTQNEGPDYFYNMLPYSAFWIVIWSIPQIILIIEALSLRSKKER